MKGVRISLSLNLVSLVLGLGGAVLAAYPALSPFRGQQLRPILADTVIPLKTPAFEAWEVRNDSLARWGLFCVAIGTAAGAAAQIAEGKKGMTTNNKGDLR